jgi:hypothetical protein
VAANLSSRELPAPLSPGAASQSGRRAPRPIVHLAVGCESWETGNNAGWRALWSTLN